MADISGGREAFEIRCQNYEYRTREELHMRKAFSFRKQITRRTRSFSMLPHRDNIQDASVTSYEYLFSIFIQTDNDVVLFGGCYEFETSFKSEH